MVTITYTTLTTLLHDTSIVAATAEAVIDQAINLLNTYGCDLPNMTGTAGSKTLSVESREAGAILELCKMVYTDYYTTSGGSGSSYNIGPLGMASSSSASAGGGSTQTRAQGTAKELAAQIKELDVDYG